VSLRRTLAAGLLCAVALVGAGAARAVPARELVAKAQAAEARKEWAEAARALEELVAAGVDSNDVLYDLGTVYANGERYGEAIWCFERVVRRSPAELDAQKNLRAARVRLARRDAARTGRAVVETSPPWRVQLGELLPLGVSVPWVVLAELVVIGAWFVRRRTSHELGRVGATVVMILAALGGLFGLSVVIARRASPPAAIVLRQGMRLLQTARVDGIPDEGVREGERVELTRREGEFVRVRTLAGKAGWLRARDVGELGD